MTGSDIRAARKRRGWTQDTLARKLGVSQALITRVENGKHEISIRLEIQLKSLLKELRDLGESQEAE